MQRFDPSARHGSALNLRNPVGLGLPPSIHRGMAAIVGLAALFSQVPVVTAAPVTPTITVGATASCDFNSLQAAVDSIDQGASGTIRLSNETDGFVAEPLLLIGRNVEIIGGYSSCTDNTSEGAAHSVIRGNGANLPVVFATGFVNAEPTVLKLTSVIVEDGTTEFGGGIRVGAKYEAHLSNVIVRNNFAMDAGGGVYVDGSNGATLRIEHDSQIVDNASGLYGGGLYCVNAEVDYRSGAIDGNETGAHGAGVFLSSCRMTGNFSGSRSISNNRVDSVKYNVPHGAILIGFKATGGGIFAAFGSRVELGSRNSTSVIAGNQIRDSHGSDPARGHGGGVYAASAGTQVSLINTHIAENLAMLGGGAYVTSAARFELSRSLDGCVAHADYPGCASITENTANGFSTGDGSICVVSDSSWAGQGGGMILFDGGSAMLDGVYVTKNRVVREDQCVFTEEKRYPHGAAFYVGGSSTLEVINTLVHRNDGVDEDDIIHVVGNQALFRAVHTSIVGNSPSVDAVIRTSGQSPRVELYSSMVISPTKPGFANDGASTPALIADCLYATNPGHFSSLPGAVVTNTQAGNSPGFVDGANSNFRLAQGANAQDACDNQAVANLGLTSRAVYDLDGRRRPVVFSNAGKAWDLGAYERQEGTAPRLTDLAVSIDDGGFNYAPNSSMGYTLSLSNEGPASVTGAGFRVDLASQVDNYTVIPFSADWDCVDGNKTIVCRYNVPLAAGATAPSVATQFLAPAIPTVLSSRIITVPAENMTDPEDSNNAAIETTSIGQDADLAATLLEEPQFATPGTRSVFRFALENRGPDVAPSARITFTLHPQAQDIRIDEAPSGWECVDPIVLPNENWIIHCQRSVASVASFEFAVSARVPSPFIESEWSVRADVQAGSNDPNTEDNEASGAAMVAPASADLALTGSGPDTVGLGNFIQYQASLKNLGPGVAAVPVVAGRFTGGSMESMIVSPPSGWNCANVGASPYTQFECVATDDVQVGPAMPFLVTAQPQEFSADTLELALTVVSATDDPLVGPGSNNERVIETVVESTPVPTEDLMFSDSFE